MADPRKDARMPAEAAEALEVVEAETDLSAADEERIEGENDLA